MKNRTTNDPRAMRSNGLVSQSRMLVLEALEACAKEGATIDEIVELIGKDLNMNSPKMSVGSVLSKMENDNYVICYRNRVTMQDGTWAQVNHMSKNVSVVAWEITRPFNGRKVMVAQSINYHPSVTAWMRNVKKLGATVVDGLLVDVQLDRTYIHFNETPKPFDSNIKIYNGTHLSIEGNVTLENYDGFIKALELAKKSYMRKF